MKHRMQTLSRLARVALLRHTVDPSKPEVKLLTDVIVQALADSKNKKATSKADRNDAIQFFSDGRMENVCNLLGLELDYAKHVVKCVRGG